MSDFIEALQAERRRLGALLAAVDVLLEAHGVDHGTAPARRQLPAANAQRRGPAKVTCEFCRRELDPRGLKTHQRKCRKEQRRKGKPLSDRTAIAPQPCPMCGRTTRTNPCEHCHEKIAPLAVKA